MCVYSVLVNCILTCIRLVALTHCFLYYINLITNVCLTIDLTGVGIRLSERNLGRVGGRGRELIELRRHATFWRSRQDRRLYDCIRLCC